MIFVTVGTHEQQFNRLIKAVDELEMDEEIIMQIGYATYEPKNCKWKRIFSAEEIHDNLDRARIIITHGGPSSFLEALAANKIPIVVPRRPELGEHVDNHQILFTKKVSEEYNSIIVVLDMERLAETIEHYDQIIGAMSKQMQIVNNNAFFIEKLREQIDLLVTQKHNKR